MGLVVLALNEKWMDKRQCWCCCWMIYNSCEGVCVGCLVDIGVANIKEGEGEE